MPHFELSDLEGKPTGDEQLRGHVVVLHLFDLLAPDRVHAENPRADAAIEALKPLRANYTDVAFLSIGLAGFFDGRTGGHATATERAAMVAGFRDRHNATWAFASEPTPRSIARLFDAPESSVVLLFDTDGILRARIPFPEDASALLCLPPSLDLLLSDSPEDIPC